MSVAASYPQNRPIVMDMIRELNPKSILDMGIGTGFYGEMIRRDLPKIKLDGIEVWDKYENKRWKHYNNIIRKNILDVEFNKYSLFLMVDVLEHFEKEIAIGLLKALPGPILISTPWYYPQGPDENPNQEHLSVWKLEDLKEFKVLQNKSNHLSLIVLIENQ